MTLAEPGITLTATTGGVSATSNAFDVLGGNIATLSWGTNSTPQAANVPFSQTLTAHDVYGNIATYDGAIALSGLVTADNFQTLLGNRAATSSTSSGPYTVGYAFTPNTNIRVTDVRSYFGSKVSIWTNTGILLASQAVSGPGGSWTQTPLATPITLLAGSTYRIGAYTPGAPYYFGFAPPNPSFATLGQTYEGFGDHFPNLSDSEYFLVDLRGNIGPSTLVPISPISATLIRGVWSGNIAVLQPAANVHLHARFDTIHDADTSNFDVIAQTLTFSLPPDIHETDGAISGTLNVYPPAPIDMTVTLSSSDSSRLSAPPSVLVSAGSTSIPLTLTATDNTLLDGLEPVTMTATSPYATGSAIVNVHDNETASLSVSIPATAREGDGTLAGTITASAAPVKDITVQLSSSNTSRLTVPATIKLLAGQTSASFNLSIVDDTAIDFTQSVTVTAAVDAWTSGFNSISVADNDNLMTVTLPVSGWEGQTLSNAGTVRIGGTLGSDLSVSLTPDDSTKLTVPTAVIIPAGQTSATFTLTLPTDSVEEGSRTATVSATASILPGASSMMVIHDSNLDHLAFDPITGVKTAGVPFAATVRAFNNANEQIAVYAGAGTLSAAGQSGPLSVAPTSLTFTAGASTGNITLTTADPAITLTTTSGGLSATSNSFVLQANSVSSFSWSNVPTPQIANVPFAAAITARDFFGNLASSFSGTVAFSGLFSATSSQTIFGNATDTANSAGTFTFGYTFEPSVPAVVTAVRSYFGTKVSIWSGSGTLLASTPVSGTPGTWTETPLSTPLTLQQFNTYRIGVYTGGGSYYWRTSSPTFSWGFMFGSAFSPTDSIPSTSTANTYLVDLRATVTTINSVPITPTSATFVNGTWSGNISVTQAQNAMYLEVVRRGIAGQNVGDSNTFDVVSPPQAPDLDAGADSGISSSDNITNFNNSQPSRALSFAVSGTMAGWFVNLYADGQLVGSAVASGTTTTVVTDGVAPLADGQHLFTARLANSSGFQTPDSPALALTIDAAAPTATLTITPAAPGSTVVGSVSIVASAPTTGLAIASLSITRDGGGNLLTVAQSLVQGSSSSYSLGNLAAVDALKGAYLLTLAAAGLSDVAGNAMVSNATLQWTTDPLQGTAGNDSYYLKADGDQIDLWFNQPTTAAPAIRLPRSLAGEVIHGMGGNDSITIDQSAGDIFPFLVSIDSAAGTIALRVIGTTGDDDFSADGAAGTISFGANSIVASNLGGIEYDDDGGNDSASVSGAIPLTLDVGPGTDTLNVAAGSNAIAYLHGNSTSDLIINGNGNTVVWYI
jgi:hypothetical protein